MKELTCEVYQDLIPSYVDGVCSEQSKALVEEHLKECSRCREIAARMKDTQIVTGQADQKEIDYMKKVKQKVDQRSMVSFGLLMLVLVVGISIVIASYGSIPSVCYYVALPAVMIGSYFIGCDQIKRVGMTKGKIGLGLLSIGLIVYSMTLNPMCMSWIENGTYPAGMKIEQVGPFLYRQFLGIALIQIVIFLVTMILRVRARVSYLIVQMVSLTGSGLAFLLIAVLKGTAQMETYRGVYTSATWTLLLEGVLLTILAMILEKRTRNLSY